MKYLIKIAPCFCLLALLLSACMDSWNDLDTEESAGEAVLKDSRDGRVYKTVQIGSQVWMAENMNYYDAQDSLYVKNSWCYDDSQENCEIYGRLYNWEMASRVCPEGWQLPSKEDFITLFESAGGLDVAGVKLKAAEVWADSAKGEDAFGMRVLPAGYYFMDMYSYIGETTYFWTSTEALPNNNNSANFAASRNRGVIDQTYVEFGLSVRCIKAAPSN